MAGDNCSNDGSYASICTKIEADSAFLFLGFIAAVVLIGLGFLTRNNGRGTSYGTSTV